MTNTLMRQDTSPEDCIGIYPGDEFTVIKSNDNSPVAYAPSPGKSDTLFDDQSLPASDFRFDAKVAGVFDDMVSRSVPFYHEIQGMTCQMAADFAEPGSEIYDIGCSTGTTLIELDAKIGPDVSLVGIDNSAEMIEKARKKLEQGTLSRNWRLINTDIHQNLPIDNASVVTMVLTLQFARPLYRERIMERIYNGLNKNGCLIIIEKLVQEDSRLNRMFIDHYYDFKRANGYSETEIAKKREALENVLVPYRFEENRELLKSAGFGAVEEFFRWYNFCGIIAVK